MRYVREDTICLVSEVDGIKCTVVYVLEWRNGHCQASVMARFPRQSIADGMFDLDDAPEPIDFVPEYVGNMLSGQGSQYADLAQQLTAYAIIVMGHCLEGQTDLLGEVYHQSFDSVFATYESHTEASSRQS